MFWAITTTVLFAVAAVALLTNRMALLASRLLILMVGFGLLAWLALTLSNPRNHTNWSENAETFEIAGAVWILADLLGEHRLNGRRPRTGAADSE
jgi:hypothetical protein